MGVSMRRHTTVSTRSVPRMGGGDCPQESDFLPMPAAGAEGITQGSSQSGLVPW